MKTMTIEIDDATWELVTKLGTALSDSPKVFAAECVEQYIGMVKDSGAMELEGTMRRYDTLEEARTAVQTCQEMDGREYEVSYFERPDGTNWPPFVPTFGRGSALGSRSKRTTSPAVSPQGRARGLFSEFHRGFVNIR